MGGEREKAEEGREKPQKVEIEVELKQKVLEVN